MKSKGRERWVIEWQELNATGKRLKAEEEDGGPLYEHDRDIHEKTICLVVTTETEAHRHARRIVRSGVTVYGHATVQLERYLPIEGTVHFDWEPIGEPEYIDAGN